MLKKNFYFYVNNVKIKEVLNDSKIKLSTDSFNTQIELKYGDGGIILFPSNNTTFVTVLERFGKFQLIDENKIEVLKYLFDEYGLMFYDGEYTDVVSFLDQDKDYKLYDAVLRNYTLECLLHYGIIDENDPLNNMLYNESALEYAHIKRYRRMLLKLQWLKIKRFFLRLIVKIKNVFKRNNKK